MSEQRDSASMTGAAETGGTLSRRQALTAAGLLVATANLASAQGRSPGSDAQPGRPLGEVPAPENAVEFMARFTQTGSSGDSFASFGYLTRVAGAGDSDLFAGSVRNESTALFTAYAEGTMVQRTIDQSVHAMDIVGTLTVYQRTSPGASYAEPNSFRTGAPVAQFDMTLHDILTVILPGKGIPTLNGAMLQTRSDGLSGRPTGRRFGHAGSRARFFATGQGTLVDPATLNSVLEMAGHWVLE